MVPHSHFCPWHFRDATAALSARERDAQTASQKVFIVWPFTEKGGWPLIYECRRSETSVTFHSFHASSKELAGNVHIVYIKHSRTESVIHR